MRKLFDLDKTLRPLRLRQENAKGESRLAIRAGHKHFVMQGPTGFGKTLWAAHVIAAALEKGLRVVFICPAINLVNQTLDAFEAEGIYDIGIMQAQHDRTDHEAMLQIASAQTLICRELPQADLVLIDECHQQFQKLNDILDDEWKEKIVIGLSATPWTKGMGLRWTKLIVAATIQELINERLLCPFDVYAPKVEPDFSQLKVRLGEFTESSSSALMGSKSIVADVVKTWVEKGTGDRTFLFAVNRAHARKLQEEFTESEVSCGYIDAYTDGDERKEIFKRFRAGEFQVIASVGCLTTGVDEDVRCIIDAQPTRDEKKHVQKIGRGLRTAPGKARLLILDHAGNNIRLGMVTDIYHDRLDTRLPGDKGDAYDGDPTPSKPKPRKCPNCNIVIPQGKSVCLFCKHKFEDDHGVQTTDGELFLLSSPPKNKKAAGLNEQDWYSGFLAIAEERGHSQGWAAHRFKSKFGEFPVRLRKEPKKPSIAMRAFDHHERIKFVKGREKAQA